ncbi:MAG: SIMPL domain-containing protein [Oscillatoriales cyanobacterium C42_A2020_001]|nr:SIMPL domain-containing protein [Leptolyngbyaceae cyanobacterium C42_A2020_001]
MRIGYSCLHSQQVSFITATVFSCLGFGLSHAAIAQETLLRTLVVTGRGTEDVATTKAQIQLGVEAQGKTPQAVQAEVIQRSNAVVKLLRSRGVKKLTTTDVSLNPTYQNHKGTQTLTGYAASTMVSFQVESAKAGAIVGAAVDAGASRISGVRFIADEDAISQARKTALREATDDAQTQADTVLKALGIGSREVISVRVDGAYVSNPEIVRLNVNQSFTGRDGLVNALEVRTSALETQQFATTTKLVGESIFEVASGNQSVNASVTLQIRY